MRHYMLVVNGNEVHIPRYVPALKKGAPDNFPEPSKVHDEDSAKKEEEEDGTVLLFACKEKPRRH
ncbi:hypothetical protein HPB50_018520 [Hyalomma asiaticum]|uniref:Uncharacterized protein n=1 Tax=Hyalomma asiaticum TaxID=266040 RepID=A0ACB7TM07_HYAAI|nr:hypothetical protein HPB50_018520 [Hyalomma asiaticum]